MIELNFSAIPLLKAHKQLDCTNCAQISEIWCNINYSGESLYIIIESIICLFWKHYNWFYSGSDNMNIEMKNDVTG